MAEDRPRLSRLHPAWWISTVFGIGCLPRAPGTWGSLAATVAAYGINGYLAAHYMVIVALTIFGLGWLASAAYVARSGRDDPQEVVIDEVAGQWLALAAAPPSLAGYAIGFMLFRAFDILKPFPASWCERRLGGGLGVMADDMVAGGYSILIIVIGTYFDNFI